MIYKTLSWDSTFLGIKVAKIIPSVIEERSLCNIVNEISNDGIRLVYWPSKRKMSENMTNKLGGVLVDIKTTLTVDMDMINSKEIASFDIITPYSPNMSIDQFYSLSVQCGELSRFSVDKNIPQKKLFELYEIWIKKSLSKETADEVLVIYKNKKLLGFVTLAGNNGQGVIGLLVVDKHYRGQKYGEKLVRAAQQWFILHGYRYGQVVTQGSNIAAMNLYKKCGYSIEKQEYFYHFWL